MARDQWIVPAALATKSSALRVRKDPRRSPVALVPVTMPEPVLAPADATAHQSGPLQHLHVLRDPVKRDGESAGEAADVELAPRQDPEDGPAGRVGDGRVDPVQPGTVRGGRGRRLRGASSEHRYHSTDR